MTRTLISADSHVNEAPDLFETRLPAAMRERGPRLRTDDDGRDVWITEGLTPSPLTFGVHAAGKRGDGEAFDQRSLYIHRDEMVRGSFDPHARLADMDRDGLAAEVLYPGPLSGLGGGGTIANIADTELRHACIRAYNDWLADFCATAPGRFAGIALLRIEEPDFALTELERVAELGFRAGIVNAMPDLAGGSPLFSERYEPIWSRAEDLGFTLSLHILHARNTAPLTAAAAAEANLTGQGEGLHQVLNHVGSGTGVFETYMTMMYLDMAEPLSLLVFSGILERHANLRFALAECGVGWIAFTLERMDAIFHKHRTWMQTIVQRPPSEYFHEHCFATFQDDDLSGLLTRELIGIDNLMWASDYPHTDTTFPYSQQVVDRMFERIGVPEAEADRIAAGNARRLYDLA